ncbi:ATP-binding protein [Histidinibacterium aquaticum]|uniref:ATP-binding protein n=1 Tax=Histidinibacterium aquaticum TaxID=2613962 RepID=UPI0037C19909
MKNRPPNWSSLRVLIWLMQPHRSFDATPAEMLGHADQEVIDELGYLPFELDAAHLFFQLVSRRYERGALLVTSNRAIGEWGSVFGDAVVATAILDRLLHHSHVITIRGESYRLREKRRSGLLQKAAPAHQTINTSNSEGVSS